MFRAFRYCYCNAYIVEIQEMIGNYSEPFQAPFARLFSYVLFFNKFFETPIYTYHTNQ
jgi:hypothetical protein